MNPLDGADACSPRDGTLVQEFHSARGPGGDPAVRLGDRIPAAGAPQGRAAKRQVRPARWAGRARDRTGSRSEALARVGEMRLEGVGDEQGGERSRTGAV